jgi:hypothetical protein
LNRQAAKDAKKSFRKHSLGALGVSYDEEAVQGFFAVMPVLTD